MSFKRAFWQDTKKDNTSTISTTPMETKKTMKNNHNHAPLIATTFKPGYGLPNSKRLAVVQTARIRGISTAAKVHGVSVGTAHNYVNALGTPALDKLNRGTGNQQATKPLRDHPSYNERDRITICNFALENTISDAHKVFGVAKSSVYGWMKTYNMQVAYWNRDTRLT